MNAYRRSAMAGLRDLAFVCLSAAAIALSWPAPALGADAPIPAAPTRWVTDQPGLLSTETRRRLDARLEAYEQRTGHQVLVWIGDTLGDHPLDDWSVRTFEAWRVGRAGIDDGLVLFVLARDRKIAVEVGYGLEDRVPDAIASRIIRDVMAPRLRAGDADGAVSGAVESLLTAIEGGPAPPGAGEPMAPGAERPRGVGTTKTIGIVVLVVLFLILFATNPSLAIALLWMIASGRGGGGGNGGGFGGGGGRSGGGGARGSW